MRIGRVLIANRGEIAERIVRACRTLGIESVVAVSAADKDSLAAQRADRAVCIGPAQVSESYLNQDALLAAALGTGADAIHPGYGFLAENPAFADACERHGVTFVGPRGETVRTMGNKLAAREVAERYGVPVVPGSAHIARYEDAVKIAGDIGYPVLFKAAAGGGGRGIRIVHGPDELRSTFEHASAEGAAAFGDGALYLERYVAAARHIEVQVFADRHGNVLHLGERDCSMQRRYQKIVEEAPAALIPEEARASLSESAAVLTKGIDYENAGTVEFLYDEDRGEYYFLEMNTRIQVEHPVTEEITGLDLVREQFRIARGEPLGYADPPSAGHAIEFRINAEDPGRGFLPAPGTLTRWHPPSGPGVRVDGGYDQGETVPGAFDSLIAKLIVTGRDRDEALRRSRRALAEFEVAGMPTVIPFHRALLDEPAFTAADGAFAVHTHWIESEFTGAIESYAGAPGGDDPAELERVTVEVSGKRFEVVLPAGLGSVRPAGNGPNRPRRTNRSRGAPAAVSGDALTSPMQGTLVKVVVEDGDRVEAGATIVVLEAMKMEQPVVAHKAGTVTALRAAVGSTVSAGAVLCEIKD